MVDGQRLTGELDLTTAWIDADGAIFRLTPGRPSRVQQSIGGDGTLPISTHEAEPVPMPEPVHVPAELSAKHTRRARRRLAGLLAAVENAINTTHELQVRRSRERFPDLAEQLACLDLAAGVWSARVPVVTIALGDQPLSPITADSVVPDSLAQLVRNRSTVSPVPIAVDLTSVPYLSIDGPRHATIALARSILLQAAITTGPHRVRIRIASDQLDDWEWLKWLPHLDSDGDHTIVIHDQGHSPTVEPNTTVVSVTTGSSTAMLRVTSEGMVIGEIDSIGAVSGTLVGIGTEVAERAARRLAGFSSRDHRVSLPRRTPLSMLVGLDDSVRLPDQIIERWLLHERTTNVPIGRSATGPTALDLTDTMLYIVGRSGSGRRTAASNVRTRDSCEQPTGSRSTGPGVAVARYLPWARSTTARRGERLGPARRHRCAPTHRDRRRTLDVARHGPDVANPYRSATCGRRDGDRFWSPKPWDSDGSAPS